MLAAVRLAPLLLLFVACGGSDDTDTWTSGGDCGTVEEVIGGGIPRYTASWEATAYGVDFASEVPCDAFCGAPSNTPPPPRECTHTLTEDVAAGSTAYEDADAQDIVGEVSCTWDAVILCD